LDCKPTAIRSVRDWSSELAMVGASVRVTAEYLRFGLLTVSEDRPASHPARRVVAT
jgi:hypothetical protein